MLVGTARRVTICVDVWSKPNLTSSFLCILACFFDPRSHVARHVVLGNKELPIECLADAIQECSVQWAINKDHVLMVISDNGSIMVKEMTDE